ncbi:MAG: hypothetical protein ACRD1W_00375, partial [Vicinamibacterales bacterium]
RRHEDTRGRKLSELGDGWQLEAWTGIDGRVGETLPEVSGTVAKRRVTLHGTVVQIRDESDQSLILAVAGEGM